MGNIPQELRNELWVFPPNKACNGGTSWWLGCDPEPLLIDCPPLEPSSKKVLKKLAAGRTARIVLTNREAHGRVRELQEELGWPLLLQEQEAYLLPGVASIETFVNEHTTRSGMELLWTPGPTPGSCVLYAPHPWNVLFCGRLLIPVAIDCLASPPNRRTFHQTLQKNSLEKLKNWPPSKSRPALASGAGLRMLAGKKLLDWEAWNGL